MEHWRINLYTIWFFTNNFSHEFLDLDSRSYLFYMQDLGVTDPDQIKLYTGILTAAPAITMGIYGSYLGYTRR